MKRRLLAAALAAVFGVGAAAPALADGAAVTRTIIPLGIGAGILITNYNHKVRERRSELHEIQRRQSAYRDWFYKKHGYYPTQEQFEEWYKQTYGVSPAQ